MFEEVDEKATQRKAKEVLKKYRMLANISDTQYETRITTVYSFMPRSATNNYDSDIDKHIIRQMNAKKRCDEIEQAINNIINSYERQVLVKKYCAKEKKVDKQIYIELEYQESEYYRILNKALLSFAETYKSGDLITLKNGKGIDCFLK